MAFHQERKAPGPGELPACADCGRAVHLPRRPGVPEADAGPATIPVGAAESRRQAAPLSVKRSPAARWNDSSGTSQASRGFTEHRPVGNIGVQACLCLGLSGQCRKAGLGPLGMPMAGPFSMPLDHRFLRSLFIVDLTEPKFRYSNRGHIMGRFM